MLGKHMLRLSILLCVFALLVLGQDCSASKPCATGCCSKSGFCGTTLEHCGDGCLANCDYKLGCDANNPCEEGCCNKFGFCGHGPDFCGKNVCVAGCERKSECDPGFGGEWSESKSCPLNVCCSDFGYCGTTKEFCGNKTVKHETCSKDRYMDRVVGYYEGWSSRRPCHAFWPEQIPLGVYSHVNFAFATIDPDTYKVTPSDHRDVDLYSRLTSLKSYDKDLKVMIAIGGWTFNDPGRTATVFSDIAASEAKQDKFIASLISFMSTHDFDGIDLDWEYPEADDRNGKPEDFKNFPKFMARLKNELKKTPGRSELSITLPASYWYLQHFDLKELAKHVSFFNIMSYDLHGTWDQGNKWTGAFLNAHTNLTEIKSALELLWRNDVKGDQVVMGLAFYGRSYTTQGCVEPGCVYASGGLPGPCSNEAGILLNNEIMDIIHDRKLVPKLYKEATVKVVTWDDQWVSMDDRETLAMKANFARQQCLSGLMVWAISHDTSTADFSRDLAMVSNRQVLMQRAEIDTDIITERTNHKQCHWTNCGDSCPAGWQMIKREDDWKTTNPEYMIDDTHCEGHGSRSWCCPPDAELPKCGWYNFNRGNCKPGCEDGMVEIGSTTNGCKKEDQYQSACCSVEDDYGNGLSSMAVYNTCEWSKENPQCDDGKCSGSKSTILGQSGQGSGDVYCYAGDVWGDHWPKIQHTLRKYCCNTSSKSNRFENCEWRNDVGLHWVGQSCFSGCDSNQVRVAMDGFNEGCYKSGARAYCCDAVSYTETERMSDDLQKFKDALIDWTIAVECTNYYYSATPAKSLSIREDDCEIFASHILVAHLVEILMGYESKQTTHWQRLVNIWNDVVSNQLKNLNTRIMLPFVFSNTSFPELLANGYQTTAKNILDVPDWYDKRFGNKDSGITCSKSLCDYEDGFCDQTDDDDDDDDMFTRRDLQWQKDNGPVLQKRASSKPMDFICIGKAGVERVLAFTRFAYPGPKDWLQLKAKKPDPKKQVTVNEAVDYNDDKDCGDTAIQERQATTAELDPPKGKKSRFNTDHLLEIKLIPKFMLWAIGAGNCPVDCDFFIDYFGEDIIPKTAEKTPGNNLILQKPIARVMEQLGSKTNFDVFRLMDSALNAVKGDLWSFDRPQNTAFDDATWLPLVDSDDSSKALTLLRSVFSVYNYQNSENFQKRFNIVYKKIRGELDLAATEYFKLSGKAVDLGECWDRFFKIQKDLMVSFGRKFVEKGIEELATRWANDSDKEKAEVVNQVLKQLREKMGQIYMNDFKAEYQPSWK
ncbi:CAZyme family GH18 [Penicillium roqueforti]|nr:CAZyme family GH18 [Penicillium roqueforti]KAI2686543.1 CAZyme family GH18 [Penicillium roqueforti]KAI2715836.1 CAZyme family GH18 [Penicillium roqueforti]KAI3116245.1 CAZyme family GH18 [Penicillium roqueforti]KAI3237640.1 CAZyme family GH18 [Penicillium roqueforti]